MMQNGIHQQKQKKGAVLIMALVITSGILVLGSELVLFVLNSLQYGRSVDYSWIAQYAAESGVENALWQIRKEGRVTLDDTRLAQTLDTDGQWSFADSGGALDALKFDTEIDRIEKMFLPENGSLQAALYTEVGGSVNGVPNMTALKISWENESCAPDNQLPWIETSIVQWEGGSSIDWSAAQVKKDFQQPLIGAHVIIVNFDSYGMTGKPMVVRVKTMFCDLFRLTLAIYSDPAVPDTAQLKIPQYVMANPTGTYRRFHQNMRAVFPQKSALSGMFDFVLFSEEPLQKVGD